MKTDTRNRPSPIRAFFALEAHRPGLLFVVAKPMDAVLERVKEFAGKAHGSQTRKYSPEQYILHPVRVMALCREHTDQLPLLAAALLHDVLEDTKVDKKELWQFLLTVMTEEEAKQTLQLVIELTDVYTKGAYPRLNRRRRKEKEAARIKKTSGASQTVKYADIIDNCREIVQKDPAFARVFLRECKGLLSVISNGNKVLYEKAVLTVDACLQQLAA